MPLPTFITPTRQTNVNGILQRDWNSAALGITPGVTQLTFGTPLTLGPFDVLGFKYLSMHGKLKADAVTAPNSIVTARPYLYSIDGTRIEAASGGTSCSWGPATDTNDHELIWLIGNVEAGSDMMRDLAAVILATSSPTCFFGFGAIGIELTLGNAAPPGSTATLKEFGISMRSR